eukprot:499255-Rhodomonas_salina.1
MSSESDQFSDSESKSDSRWPLEVENQIHLKSKRTKEISHETSAAPKNYPPEALMWGGGAHVQRLAAFPIPGTPGYLGRTPFAGGELLPSGYIVVLGYPGRGIISRDA